MNDKQLSKVIVERMRKKVGAASQQELAKILSIKPPSISGAIQKGKIPSRWFDVMEEKFGVTRDELCKHPEGPSVGITAKTPDGDIIKANLIMPYGDADDFEECDHYLKEMALLFQQILRWQGEVNGPDSLTSMNFVREFHERFPELGEWLKKRKGKNIPDRELQDSIADGTDG